MSTLVIDPDGVNVAHRSRFAQSKMERLVLVLWNGDVGGAEVFSVSLARRMRQMGREVSIVFLGTPQPLATRIMDTGDVPYRTLGLTRGRQILFHPRRYATAIAETRADGVMLVSCGLMGAALRAGGYRGPIVAVEHGDVLESQFYSMRQRTTRWIGRLGAVWADDVEIAVSDFVLSRLREQPHTRVIGRIYNGVDPDEFASEEPCGRSAHDDQCVIAFAGRLIYGKGADHLIEAVAALAQRRRVKLLIAGDGPERPRLESLAHSLGLGEVVHFGGLEHDIGAYWQACDIAAIPSTEFTESCPMTTLEAMASGKPVVATHNGGLPELVIDGETGIVVPPHDKDALTNALAAYVESPALRIAHGAAGRARVMERFHIEACARAYLNLFDDLVRPAAI